MVGTDPLIVDPLIVCPRYSMAANAIKAGALEGHATFTKRPVIATNHVKLMGSRDREAIEILPMNPDALSLSERQFVHVIDEAMDVGRIIIVKTIYY